MTLQTKPLLYDINLMTGQSFRPDILTNEDAVQNAVLTFMLTQQRSRKFRSTEGNMAYYFLQQDPTVENAQHLRISLFNGLQRQVPVASFTLPGINVSLTPDRTGFTVTVRYTSNLTGFQNSVSVNLSITSAA